jgi:hypothetical protein
MIGKGPKNSLERILWEIWEQHPKGKSVEEK